VGRLKNRKGQMMVITAVIVSVMMVSVSASVTQLGQKDYEIRDEAYLANMLEKEASEVDTRYTKERENFEKMVNSISSYRTSVNYWYRNECFNVTLTNRDSRINLNCI